MIFLLAITAAGAMIAVLKKLYIVVLISEGRALLRIIALRSDESACVST